MLPENMNESVRNTERLQQTNLISNDRQILVKLSEGLITLVRRHLLLDQSDSVQQAIALWCHNQPHWYQSYIWKILEMRSAKLHEATKKRTHFAVASFARNLYEEEGIKLFLLDDGIPLAKAYASLRESPEFLDISRKSFPRHRLLSYFELFAIVNKAALQSKNKWKAFVASYRELFIDFISNNPRGQAFDKILERSLGGIIPKLRGVIKGGGRIIIVDSGMQGTFALAALVKLQCLIGGKEKQFDFRLLATYPWLGKLFKGRYQSTDAALVADLERSVEIAR